MILLIAVFVAVYALEGARYLIITTDALAPVVQPLAEWKHFSGMQCKVATLSEIGGSDTTSIKNYIRNAYDNWPVRPEFILLVGSPMNIPARYYRILQMGSYYSDNIYGDVNGDLYLDIPVGRFPARTARQCSVMVAKTIAYERYTETSDSLWMRRLTTVINENGDSDDTIYWNDVRIAASLAGANNFVSCDSLSQFRGDNADSVIASVNKGTAIVLYRGNGVGNWYDPFAVNPYLTGNGYKLPIVLSITCATLTLSPYEEMVADSWMKAGTTSNPKGAVAFFGNTHSLQSSTTAVRKRSTVARAFFKAVFGKGEYKLGRAIIRAKDSLYQAFRDTAEYRGFNLFGDPGLDIWTDTPRLPEVDHPAEIPPGDQELPIIITLNAQPVVNALVCISKDSSIYEFDYTDSSGAVVFNINPLDTGRLRIVVTGHNLYPYDTVIPITQVGINEAAMFPSGHKFIASPQTFSQKTRLFWTLENACANLTIFDPTGRPVRRFSNIHSGITWDGTDESGIPCPAGVYLCRLTTIDKTNVITAKILKTK